MKHKLIIQALGLSVSVLGLTLAFAAPEVINGYNDAQQNPYQQAVAQAQNTQAYQGQYQSNNSVDQPAEQAAPKDGRYQAQVTDRSFNASASPSTQSDEQGSNFNQLPLASRINRLENQISQLKTGSMVNRLNQLQREVANLRGQLEMQNHQLSQLLNKPSEARRPTLDAIDTNRVEQVRKPLTRHESHARQVVKHVQSRRMNDYAAYEDAYHFVKVNNFKKAEVAFKGFIKTHPKSRFLSNAHYWLGELYLQSGRFADAEEAFQTVLNNYPKSNKAADSLLKLGYVYYDTGKWQEARTSLDRVMAMFPNTASAKLAASRLRNMNQQGL